MIAVDVPSGEALGYAILAATIALLPMVGYVCVLAIRQYAKVKEAWVIAQQNRATLENHVIPKLNALKSEGDEAHGTILDAIQTSGNGNGNHTAA